MAREDTALDVVGWTDEAAQVAPFWPGFLARHTEAAGGSINTVRTYLAHVFAKTDTRRQAELVRHILTGPAALSFHRTSE